MKIALAQLNYTVGDVEGNASKVIEAVEKAKQKNADLVVFAEQALSGTPAYDLLNKATFVELCEEELERIAEHYVGINTGSERKYRIIKEASQKLNCPVAFDVLYYAQKTNNEDVIDEIGQKEGELIRQYRPLLNTQIPKAEDWRKWKVKPINAEEVLKLLLDE